MTDRPEDIQKRLAGLDDIGMVIGALRAMAASHLATASQAIPAIAAYARTVGRAVDAAEMAAETHPDPQQKGAGLLLVIGASQGFSGAYPSRIAEGARSLAPPDMHMIVIGQRTLQMLADQDHRIVWSADLPGSPDAIPDLASRITDVLIEISESHPGPIRAVIGASETSAPPGIRALFPPSRPAATTPRPAPVMTMPVHNLLQGLLREALFAEIAQSLTQGMRAEAQARVETMARAQNNLRRRRSDVEWNLRQARQEQMTTEMIEIAVSRPQP